MPAAGKTRKLMVVLLYMHEASYACSIQIIYRHYSFSFKIYSPSTSSVSYDMRQWLIVISIDITIVV